MQQVEKPRPTWQQIMQAYRRQETSDDDVQENIFCDQDVKVDVTKTPHRGRFPSRSRITMIAE